MAENVERVLDIKVNYGEAIKAIAEYQTAIDGIKKNESELKDELAKGNITRQEYNEKMAESKVKTNELKEAQKVLQKQMDGQLKVSRDLNEVRQAADQIVGKNVKSIKEAVEQNRILREAVRNISDEEEGAYELRQKLNSQIEENTRYIKRNSDAYIQQKMTIGDYKEQVKEAFHELRQGGMTMDSVGIIAKNFASILNRDMKQGFSSLMTSGERVNGLFKLMRTTMLAIPIVAVVTALASLAAAFTRTQAGSEGFQKIMAGIGATFDVVLDRLATFGNAVVKFFKGDFSGAAEEAKKAFTGIGEEIKTEYEAAKKLKEEMIAIEKAETLLNAQRAKSRAEIERLKFAAEDASRTNEERMKAAQAAFNLEQDLEKKQINLQQRRIANMLGYTEVTKEVLDVIDELGKEGANADAIISKIGLSESTLTDLQDLSQEVVNLYDMQQSSVTRQIELNNKLNTLRKDGLDIEAERLGISQEEMERRAAVIEETLRQEAEQAGGLSAVIEKMHQDSVAKSEQLMQKQREESLSHAEQYAENYVAIERAKEEAMAEITGGLIELTQEIGENNKAFAMASKVLALAEIAINTGKAIAAGVAQSQSVPFPANIAAVATTIATVMANITSAIKTVKSAKFATGGDVVGAGTGTSDSIPAMLSNGESVMTANATSMFAPLLSTFNQMGGGVPIYGQQAGSQAMGEDMLARAFAKGVANLSPVVSVEEITRVTNRVKVLENLGVGYEGN
jgi:DNA repair exonuclease SbcCD ATPase subunit